MKFRQNMFIVIASISLGACSSISGKQLLGGLAAGAANTQVAYDKMQCRTIQSRCVQGHYEEWETSDGTPGCSCKNYD